jgi:hypothetical protein
MAVATQRTTKTFNEILIYCFNELNPTFNGILTIPFISVAMESGASRREKLGMTSRDPPAAFIHCRKRTSRFLAYIHGQLIDESIV